MTGAEDAWTQSKSMTFDCSTSVILIESTLTPFNPSRSSLERFSSFFPLSDVVELIRVLRDGIGETGPRLYVKYK